MNRQDTIAEGVLSTKAGMAIRRRLPALRMMGHNGMHTGQIADLRRALGFKSIFA